MFRRAPRFLLHAGRRPEVGHLLEQARAPLPLLVQLRPQAPHVARARNLPLSRVLALVATHTQDRQLDFLGEKTVNVLELNLALDRLV